MLTIPRIKVLLTAILIGSTLNFLPVVAHAEEATEQTLEIYGGIIDENHPLNSEDKYTEASTDEGLTWHPAYLVGGNHPWGNVDGTNSWLNCAPSFFECLFVRSDYRYRFFLAEGWSASSLVADMKIDNYGWVSLNGTDISGQQAGAWTSEGAIDVSAITKSGWNELRVVLVDEGGWAGINFHLTYKVKTVSPIVLAEVGAPSTLDVLFDTAGGKETFEKVVYNFGADGLTLPIPTREGYEFGGWAKDSVDGIIVNPIGYVPSANVTLHALWTELGGADEEEVTPPSSEEEVSPPSSYLAETGQTEWPLLILALLLIAAGAVFVRVSKKA